MACQAPWLALFDVLIGTTDKVPDDTQGSADLPGVQCHRGAMAGLFGDTLQVFFKRASRARYWDNGITVAQGHGNDAVEQVAQIVCQLVVIMTDQVGAREISIRGER